MQLIGSHLRLDGAHDHAVTLNEALALESRGDHLHLEMTAVAGDLDLASGRPALIKAST